MLKRVYSGEGREGEGGAFMGCVGGGEGDSVYVLRKNVLCMAGVVWKIWYVCALASRIFWLCEYIPAQTKLASQLSRVGGISYVFLAGSNFTVVCMQRIYSVDNEFVAGGMFGIL